MQRLVLSTTLISVLGCSGTPPRSIEPESVTPSPRGTTSAFNLAPPDLQGERRLSLWATHYRVHQATSLRKKGHMLLDSHERPLGPRLSLRDFCSAAMQGSVQVMGRDGVVRTYNYVGLGEEPAADCTPYYPNHPALGRSRFHRSRHPLGEGAAGGIMVPYRTIAADPRVLPPGTVLYVPGARGLPIDTAESQIIHDGYFYVADVGGAVKGNHVDVFLGLDGRNPFPFVKSSPARPFSAFIVRDPEIKATLAAAHRMPKTLVAQEDSGRGAEPLASGERVDTTPRHFSEDVLAWH